MKNVEAVTSTHTSNTRTKRMEVYSHWILNGLFCYARFLDVINCHRDRQHTKMLPAKKHWKMLTSIVRVIIIISYWDVIPNLFYDFFHAPRSFMQLFSMLQVFSVAVFSMGLFWMKVRNEFKTIQMINHFLKLNKQIADLLMVRSTLCRKFVLMSCLKLFLTLLGYINEMPNLWDLDTYILNGWFSTVIGVYLWLGSMFVLDACYMGFLILGLMYANLGRHLQTMLANMQNIEAGSLLGASLTPYNRMKLLCDYSDKLDKIALFYCRLYCLTKEFVSIFQWNILYYLYYNFMVIVLLLNYCIWQFIRYGYFDFLQIFFVLVKIANLVLMIMCANKVVEMSEMPNQMNLDVVCSDIDIRWDTSVETFLSQRKVENLEIKVFGFFALNNEFILLMLSAIITYLFFIIQFGMSGGFGDTSKGQVKSD